MHAITTLRLCICGWVVVAYLIFLVCLNWTYSYWCLSYKRVAIIANRNPFIVRVISILTLLAIFIDPIFILAEFGMIANNTPLAVKYYGVFAYPLRIIPIYLVLYRQWMTYFRIQFQKSVDNDCWKIDNNRNNNKASQSFFIRYRNSFGHKQKVLYFIMFISVPLTIFIIIFRWFYGADGIRPITMLIVFIPIILSLILCCIFPTFHDIFNIRKEVQFASLSTSIIMFLVIVLRTIFKAKPPQLIYLGLSILSLSMPCALQICLIYYPLRAYNLPTNILWSIKYIKLKPVNHIIGIHNDLQHNMYTNISIINILQHNEGFSLFAKHLSLEFAIELLLFFIETQEYVIYIADKYGYSEEEKTENIEALNIETQIDYLFEKLIKIKLPKSAPISVIVDEATNPEPKQQIIDFFKKYIDDKASLSINISGEIRNDLKHKITNINDLSEYQLLHIWDAARDQIYGDLETSFERFQETEVFKQHYEQFMTS